MKSRKISRYLQAEKGKEHHRIFVLTGARQTGKTSLARRCFHDYTFLSIEDPVLRQTYSRLTAAQWKDLYPRAILDEVQKECRLIESIKSVYDQWQDIRYVLTGSSQLLLLEKERESLAGRCTIIDLYPLTIPELETANWEDTIPDSLYQSLLTEPQVVAEKIQALLPDFRLHPRYAVHIKAWDHYMSFGGYPALTDPKLDDEDRYKWLTDYVRTYLERDIRDLAEFRNLEPFIQLQHYMALQTAELVNHSSIGQRIGVSPKTVQRYLRYLELSYQVLVLPAWVRNEGRRLVKSPKIHFLDPGVLKGITQKRGAPSGEEFESLVVAELYKQAKVLLRPVRFYFLRTVDGREVDLLVECEEGYLAFEIKQTNRVLASDGRHLRNLQELLDKPLLHSFILSQDPETKQLASGITAVHGAYFLGQAGV